MENKCPICGCSKFVAIAHRPQARCKRCLSVERGRLTYLLLKKVCIVQPGAEFAHLAPERWFVKHTSLINRIAYSAFDIDPERYKNLVNAKYLDLCEGFVNVKSETFDYIMHHHVVEHVPACLENIFSEFKRVLQRGGYMIWSVPIRRGAFFDEDISASTTPEERKQRFGQHNHVRMFGESDFRARMRLLWGEGCDFDSADAFSEEELELAAIPGSVKSQLSGHSVLLFKKV